MIYKNTKKALIFLMVCMVQIGILQAQDQKLEKANKAYEKFAFIEAAKLYEEQIKKGNNTVEIYTKLADCYYYNGNYQQAMQCYSKLIDSPDGMNPEYFFRYAQALNNSQYFNESEKVMKMYYAQSGKKDLSEDWNETKLMENIKRQSGRYTIKPVKVNSLFSDFGIAFAGKDKVVYATAKDTGGIVKRKHNWNEKSYLKLYSADVTVDGGLENPILIKGDVNTKYHQSTPAITKDGKTMYFTRNNYFDGKLGVDKEGTTRLKIYVAQNVNGEWKDVHEVGFPINGDEFSSAHPALSADEKELYFVSDRGNKFGNTDIYVVSLKKGGLVGNDVTKLNDDINTLGRESYPFIDEAGVLYFSSDGHPGLGGLDVFAAIKNKKGGYHVTNIGDGVNSSADDFAYVIHDNTKKGYFSSNRDANDNIYSFVENSKINFDFKIDPTIYGVLKDVDGNPIENMIVEIYNGANEKVQTLYTDAVGNYTTDIEPYKEYRLLYKKPGYIQKTQIVAPLKPAEKRDYSFDFMKEQEVVVENKVLVLNDGDDLAKRLKLNPIYFDYNGANLQASSKVELDKIVEILKDRPNISLKINSHTDSRGKDEYNMKLSQKRANTTIDYIVEHGIDEERVSGKGYGETRLINRCSNGVKCSEAEHQVNRRSEFIIHVN